MPGLLAAARVRTACQLLLPLVLFAVLVAAVVKIEQPQLPRFSDKLEHAVIFALLTAIAALGHPRVPVLRAMAPALLAYGLFIECVQWGLPWREFSLLDWIADGAGIAAALALLATRSPAGRN